MYQIPDGGATEVVPEHRPDFAGRHAPCQARRKSLMPEPLRSYRIREDSEGFLASPCPRAWSWGG